MSKAETYSILPPIEQKIFRQEVPRFSWLAFIGAPGTLKTISCIYATFNWLKNNYEEKYTAIFIPTENTSSTILAQAKSLGMNLEPFKKAGMLLFSDKYFLHKGGNATYTDIPSDISKMKDGFIKRYGAQTRTLLIIDSVSSFWEKAPAMSRVIWSLIQTGCKNHIDLALTTLQLSVGTNKGFGFGAEHGADGVIRMGSVLENGVGKRWIYADKTRIMDSSRALHYWGIDHKKLFVGERVNAKGSYSSPIDAIEGMKYQSGHDIQLDRNKLLDEKMNKISASVDMLKGSFVMISKYLKKLTEIEEKKLELMGEKKEE